MWSLLADEMVHQSFEAHIPLEVKYPANPDVKTTAAEMCSHMCWTCMEGYLTITGHIGVGRISGRG